MKFVMKAASAASLALGVMAGANGASASTFASCPVDFTGIGTAKVFGPTAASPAASQCQILEPLDGSVNDNPDAVVSGFFGVASWNSVGKDDPPTLGSWTLPPIVDFSTYNYMLIFKDGNDTNLVGFLLNELYSSGGWTTPFTDPPFDLSGASTSHDVSHISYYRTTTCIVNCGGPGPGPDPIPEPATLALFGAGLAGLGALRLRRRAKA